MGNQPTSQSDHPQEESSSAAPETSELNQPNPSDLSSDLPEDFELTPELVEDEAIRGDFVIRWAVVLLAFLLGCTQIFETETLVHIKSGWDITTRAGIAPSTDTFSYTAVGQPWHNVSWLFDVICSNLFSLSGWTGLSIVKAFLAGLTFYFLVRISLKDISTWWGSVCAAMALLVCFTHFTVRPELITLLGLAILMYLLHRWREESERRLGWSLPLLFLLWNNLDPRMFLGLLFMLVYGVGEELGSKIRPTSTWHSASHRKPYWITFLLCLVASCLNRFGFQSLLSGYSLYALEYPAIREYAGKYPDLSQLLAFPLTYARFWEQINFQLISFCVLAFSTLVSFVLNRKHFSMGHLLGFLLFLGLPFAARFEMGASSLVLAALATINAQSWYRESFQPAYSTDFKSLLFIRGGRAVTVLGLFAIAYFTVSGRIDGPNGRRTGLGLSQDLTTRTTAMVNELKESYDNRPFHFRPDQGDLLIWANQKSFVDHRTRLFSSVKSGEETILQLHHRVRGLLRLPDSREKRESQVIEWKSVFDKYQITHAIPRILGPSPDYVTFSDLLVQPEWSLTHLEALGIFHRTDLKDEKLISFLREHRTDIISKAFREKQEVPDARIAWAKPRTFYDDYFHQPITPRPIAAYEAQHYLNVALLMSQQPIQNIDPDQLFSLIYLSIRKSNEALLQESDCALAYALLGQSYNLLAQLENQFIPQNRVHNDLMQQRYLQSVIALNQAVLLNPADSQSHTLLGNLYRNHGRIDLAWREFHAFEQLQPFANLPVKERLEREKRFEEMMTALEEGKQTADEFLNNELKQGKQIMTLVPQLRQQGFLQKALGIFDQQEEQVSQDLGLILQKIQMMMESGRVEEAYNMLQRFQEAFETTPGGSWRDPAARLYLGLADYSNYRLMRDSLYKELEQHMLQQVLAIPPVLEWPTDVSVGYYRSAVSMNALPMVNSENHFFSALSYLEEGQHDQAMQQFESMLEANPDSQHRALAAVYMTLLGKRIDPLSPRQRMLPVLRAPRPEEFLTNEEQHPVLHAPRPE